MLVTPIYDKIGRVALVAGPPDAAASGRVTLDNQHNLHVIVHGFASQTYLVEVTDDLTEWTVTGSFIMPPASAYEFIVAVDSAHPTRYYRFRYAP